MHHIYNLAAPTILMALIIVLSIAIAIGFLQRRRDTEWLQSQLSLERIKAPYGQNTNKWQGNGKPHSIVLAILSGCLMQSLK